MSRTEPDRTDDHAAVLRELQTGEEAADGTVSPTPSRAHARKPLTADDRLITRGEAARRLAISSDAIRKMQDRRELSLFKVGASARVLEREIVQLMTESWVRQPSPVRIRKRKRAERDRIEAVLDSLPSAERPWRPS